MVEKPAEWRRFEPVELEGPVAHAVSKGSGQLLYENPALALREFERLLRENERLHSECAGLRAQAAKSDNESVRFREDLDAARTELGRLQTEVEGLRATVQTTAIPLPPPADVALTMTGAVTTTSQRGAAQVVAGYLFANPNERQVRLVDDALRARGIRGE
ncbi:MAG: hypothetical protein SGI88_20735 [Candidatus Hydrogenedentes bacterium]|nr:hypothetical protein [Candidatus Hydrogenedentota bacterium]